jgi:two-component system response regulator PilR (NtrC family)
MSGPRPPRLLVVDDEPDLRTLYELTLLREGYDVETAGAVEDAWAALQGGAFDLVITDMRLPDGLGLDLLRRMEAAGRSERGIVITAYGSAENAVEALKAGAYDYLTKPVDLRQFRAVVASAVGRAGAVPAASAAAPAAASPAASSAASSAASPAATPAASAATGGVAPLAAATRRAAAPRPASVAEAALARLVGHSPAMQQVRSLVAKVARSMAPVLVHGESGTGKELVARAVHAASPRGAGPFVAVNCGAIPEALLEAEFFGVKKGAFTGANEDRDGFFQAAHGGTLFLDEIGELPLPMQSKLLRAIQERAVRPVGGVAEVPLDLRLVSATHRDLGAEVQAGRFRQDLYYRLNVIGIGVPPLRERLADLPSLCDVVVARIARDAGVEPVPVLAPAALARLARYRYPGNVRELENLLHRALALAAGGVIDEADLALPDEAFTDSELVELEPLPAPAVAAVAADDGAPLPADLAAHLDTVEREILLRALARHRGNRTAAGASLGLSLRQMRYRMARLAVIVEPTGAGEGGA